MVRIQSLVFILLVVLVSLFFGLRSNTVRSVLKIPPKPTETFNPGLIIRESVLAHQLLDGLRGVEIGGSALNPFGLKTLNIDYTDDLNTDFKIAEKKASGQVMKVDLVALGDDLPFKNNTLDFVVSSHVIEHFYDPVKTIQEWLRVVKPGGYVYMIVPHKERTFDKDSPRTALAEIIERHDHPNPPVPDHHGHHSVWITQDFVDIVNHYGWKLIAVQDEDDKNGIGFTIVLQK